jgi:hypothetical protein
MTGDLDGTAMFLAAAGAKGFRAAERPGASASVVSQAMR